MSKRSRRQRRRSHEAGRLARHFSENHCVVCRHKGHRVDRCCAGVCRTCHLIATGSWAFPDCKNFGQRCRVLPVSGEESVRRGGVADEEETA